MTFDNCIHLCDYHPSEGQEHFHFPERPVLLFAVSFHNLTLIWLVLSVLEFPLYESPTMYVFVSAFFH